MYIIVIIIVIIIIYYIAIDLHHIWYHHVEIKIWQVANVNTGHEQHNI